MGVGGIDVVAERVSEFDGLVLRLLDPCGFRGFEDGDGDGREVVVRAIAGVEGDLIESVAEVGGVLELSGIDVHGKVFGVVNGIDYRLKVRGIEIAGKGLIYIDGDVVGFGSPYGGVGVDGEADGFGGVHFPMS